MNVEKILVSVVASIAQAVAATVIVFKQLDSKKRRDKILFLISFTFFSNFE